MRVWRLSTSRWKLAIPHAADVVDTGVRLAQHHESSDGR